ncbi:MAG: M56 family metallopeptidase [Planctomycetota bacterium]
MSHLSTYLVTYLAHSTVLCLAALSILPLINGPRSRVMLLRLALLGGLLTPLLTPWLGRMASVHLPAPPTLTTQWPAQGPRHTISSPVASRLGEASEPAAHPATGETSPWNFAAIANRTAPWLLLSGLLAAGILLVRDLRWKSAMTRRFTRVQGPWRQWAEELLGNDHRVQGLQISACPALHTPLAMGRNRVILPVFIAKNAEARQGKAMLAHELAHLVRRDPLWLGLARLAVRAMWFQPLNRLVLTRLQAETELAADAWAHLRTRDGLALALGLESLGSTLVRKPLPAAALGMAPSPSELVRRVERLCADPRAESRHAVHLALLSGCLALGAVACID